MNKMRGSSRRGGSLFPILPPFYMFFLHFLSNLFPISYFPLFFFLGRDRKCVVFFGGGDKLRKKCNAIFLGQNYPNPPIKD